MSGLTQSNATIQVKHISRLCPDCKGLFTGMGLMLQVSQSPRRYSEYCWPCVQNSSNLSAIASRVQGGR